VVLTVAKIIGEGSHHVEFSHPEIGTLVVRTGADRIAWGYSLNVMVFPTYAGEVVQILSCFVDNLEVTGTLQTYRDMERLYTYFLQYTQLATQGDPKRGQEAGETSYNEFPMKMHYPHRGWEFEIMPVNVPGFRKGRDVVAPEWRVEAHVADETGDVHELKELIIKEAEIKLSVGSTDPDFDQNFGLNGVIRFTDENPFSDPWTDHGTDFAADRAAAFQGIGDYYSTLLPAYLKGDFDEITGGLGSKPAFSTNPNARQHSATDQDEDPSKQGTKGQEKKAEKIRK
jgi:hypothetical protein